MPRDDQRRHDILRLIRRHEPVGSIQLVRLLERRGYDIKDRTVRLELSTLDEDGLTEKVPGRGRRLTSAGRTTLQTGQVNRRVTHIRTRIAELTSQVTYDPVDDTGEVCTGAVYLADDDVAAALEQLRQLGETSFGPCLVTVETTQPDEPSDVRLLLPSSITLDGVLLAAGIDAELLTAGTVTYHELPTNEPDETDEQATSASGQPTSGTPEPTSDGGRREQSEGPDTEATQAAAPDPVQPPSETGFGEYVDVISGDGSSIDVVRLLIEAGYTDVTGVLDSKTGQVIADYREFPITRLEEGRDLADEIHRRLGGDFELHRPRDGAPLPFGGPDWEFCSITSVGASEVGTALLAERGLPVEWTTLHGTVPRGDLQPPSRATAEWTR
ncbi:NrpR regulatory domain-containing protein [Halobaculum sp. MBLA0147]|uniref:NrpR regulatory domain-containing protein n=1 Tax=Halobaculum sp. MBLA0147 TaxID=3079934 RepID=UPI00352314F3